MRHAAALPAMRGVLMHLIILLGEEEKESRGNAANLPFSSISLSEYGRAWDVDASLITAHAKTPKDKTHIINLAQKNQKGISLLEATLDSENLAADDADPHFYLRNFIFCII